jgi:PhzF family phenazine biosynthesis protein
MSRPLLIIDAFASQPFRGNPAAVCFLSEPADAAWMQQVAGEMNLSETAFLHPVDGGWGLRWFTPQVEVDLCGHATLASAHALWETGRLTQGTTARFHTRSGLLTAQQAGAEIVMDFPAKPAAPAPAPEGLAEALGASPCHVLRSSFDYLVQLASPDVVRALQPDLGRLVQLPARGIIVTAPSDRPEHDFISRFFAPAAGVNEDPVTGSAHCTLGPYWAARLGKTQLTGYQASRRGGVVRLRIDDGRVHLGGTAHTVLRGELG